MNADTGSGGSKRELLFCFAAVTEVTSLFTVETPQKSWGHSGGSELYLQYLSANIFSDVIKREKVNFIY